MIGGAKNRARSRGKNSTVWTAIITAAGVLATATVTVGGVYIYKGQKYKDVFSPNTTINGVDVSEKTVEEVKELTASQIDGCVLTLNQKGGARKWITEVDIGLHSELDGSLEEVLSEQKPLSWWRHREKETGCQIAIVIAYDEELLQKGIDSLECFNEEKVQISVSAYVSDYVSGQGYTVVPEEPGNLLEKEVMEAEIALAIQDLKENVFFEELSAYVKPKIISTNEESVKVVDSLNKHTNVTVIYKFGGKTEVLPGETIHGWISVSANKVIGLDRDKVVTYVKGLADKYNTAYKKKMLKTSYGREMTTSNDFYGWRINQNAETDELYGIIYPGGSRTREPICSQKADSHGVNDYGNTYAKINSTAQHLFFYRDEKLLVELDLVSGNSSKSHDTPLGVHPITYKERNVALKGGDYRTPVGYWTPFNGDIGIHNARWHSSFGRNTFKTNDSYGCMNLPPSATKTIYENIGAGMLVFCYTLEGTGGRTTSSVPKETAAATTAVPTTAALATEAPVETIVAPETSASVPEISPVEITVAPETAAVFETIKASEARQPNGPGDMGGGGNSPGGEKEPGVQNHLTEESAQKNGPLSALFTGYVQETSPVAGSGADRK